MVMTRLSPASPVTLAFSTIGPSTRREPSGVNRRISIVDVPLERARTGTST